LNRIPKAQEAKAKTDKCNYIMLNAFHSKGNNQQIEDTTYSTEEDMFTLSHLSYSEYIYIYIYSGFGVKEPLHAVGGNIS
jgi:hypothetical protein